MKLSVCMIVKNESQTLDRILNCAKKFADEIIVVDTGSIDDTKTIAKKYTDLVFDYQFNNDFASARNYSILKATGDYILWLDADDFIDDSNIKKIQNLLKTDLYADFYMFYYKNFNKELNSFDLIFYRERMFKNDHTNFFLGRCHEAVNLKGKVEYLDIVIEHRKVKPNQKNRNLNIYRKMQKDNIKFTPRDIYYHARELYYNGYFYSAKRRFRAYLKTNKTEGEGYILLSDCYLKNKQYKKALKKLFQGLNFVAPYPEYACKIGEIFFEMGDLNTSLVYYKFATNLTCNQTFTRPDYGNFIPYLMLCVIYYKKQNYLLAKSYHALAKKIHPNHPSILYNDRLPLLN